MLIIIQGRVLQQLLALLELMVILLHIAVLHTVLRVDMVIQQRKFVKLVVQAPILLIQELIFVCHHV